SVEPQGLNFDCLALTRRHYVVTDFGIHPGELDAIGARLKKSVLVHLNAVARAANVPIDYVFEYLVKVALDEVIIAGVSGRGADCFKEPPRGVDAVVFGGLPLVGESIGEHAAINMPRELG